MSFEKIVGFLVAIVIMSLATLTQCQADNLETFYQARYTPNIISDSFLLQSAEAVAQLSDCNTFSTLFSTAVDSKLSQQQLRKLIDTYAQYPTQNISTENEIFRTIAIAQAHQLIGDNSEALAEFQAAEARCNQLPSGDAKDAILSDLVSGLAMLPNGSFNHTLWGQIQSPFIKINLVNQYNPTPYIIAECPSTNIRQNATIELAIAWAKANSASNVIATLHQLPTKQAQLWGFYRVLKTDGISSETVQALQYEISDMAETTTDLTSQTLAQAIYISLQPGCDAQNTTANRYLDGMAARFQNLPTLQDKIKVALIYAPTCMSTHRPELVLGIYDALFKYQSSDSDLLKSGIRELNSKLVIHALQDNGREAARSIDQEFQTIGLDKAAIRALFWDAVSEKNAALAFRYAERESDTFQRHCRYYDLVAVFGDRPEFKSSLLAP